MLGAASLLGACDTGGEGLLGAGGSAGANVGSVAGGGAAATGGGVGGSGAGLGGSVAGGAAGTGGSGAITPMICKASYEAEAMMPSTGEAAEGGWNIYTEGSLTGSHAFKGGKTKLTVFARGSVSGGEWPHMVVKVGDQTVGELDVATDAFMAYDFEATVTAGTKDVVIEFTNDSEDGQDDRNLYVDKVGVEETCDGASGSGGSGGGGSVDSGNPFSTPLYVDPDSKAASAANGLSGADADLMKKISSSPQAVWILGGDPAGQVRGAIGKAGSQLSVLVAYNIYNRDCGSMSSGGAADATAYKSWIDGFADGIGDDKVAVVLEPDTLAHECDPSRWESLAYAVTALKAKPNAHVYIDAGHSGWVADSTMASRLKTAGIANADGFSLNVSSFQTTESSIGYGKAISGQVGNKPFIIDTSRNGKGPAGAEWCNPPGRGLGEKPTGSTGNPLVHAFFWIKKPGESDGECNGGPSAGQWFQSYALELAKNAVF
ncbi:MAG: endoglucanase [Polyangiaceae bacterium]|nr:endoglucanase [Polyangiaceae bacterium]